MSAKDITFAKLGDRNYPEWSRNMQALFMIKQAWGVVSGSVSPPPATQADKLEAYNTLKQMTAGLIWLALEPTLLDLLPPPSPFGRALAPTA